jgi:glutamate dehydrogenase/leucine dehydrogenase
VVVLSRNLEQLCSHPTHFVVQAPGYAVVHYADQILKDRNDSLEGKRCLILGSGKVARSVAEKLIDYRSYSPNL